MLSKPPQQSLQDIVDHITLIEAAMQGVSLNSFTYNLEKRAAIERWVQNITEAAFRLGDEAERLCPDIDWPNMRGVGNRLRHAYDLIDPERIFLIVEKNLPALKQSASAALNALAGTHKPNA